jgi:general stress protein 26
LDLKDKILDVLDDHAVCILSTAVENKPFSYFMILFHEGYDLYFLSVKNADKIDKINMNKDVFVLIGKGRMPYGSETLEYSGEAEIVPFNGEFWDSQLNQWLGSMDNENIVMIKVKPKKIILYSTDNNKPEVLTEF